MKLIVWFSSFLLAACGHQWNTQVAAPATPKAACQDMQGDVTNSDTTPGVPYDVEVAIEATKSPTGEEGAAFFAVCHSGNDIGSSSGAAKGDIKFTANSAIINIRLPASLTTIRWKGNRADSIDMVNGLATPAGGDWFSCNGASPAKNVRHFDKKFLGIFVHHRYISFDLCSKATGQELDYSYLITLEQGMPNGKVKPYPVDPQIINH